MYLENIKLSNIDAMLYFHSYLSDQICSKGTWLLFFPGLRSCTNDSYWDFVFWGYALIRGPLKSSQKDICIFISTYL